MQVHDFLKDHDVACPSCGYNLRDLTSETCPECRFHLELSVKHSGSGDELRAWKDFFTAVVIFDLPVLGSWAYIILDAMVWQPTGMVTWIYVTQCIVYAICLIAAVLTRIRLAKLVDLRREERRRTRRVAGAILILHGLLMLHV
ncbi:MAG: hypothetical protein KDA28_02440, partial [Phycisphaerales bacterium]|nr:hypothetical protein [Phycisphaerales bacterium]